MDCGEGTYGQIVDYCGDQAKVDAVVRKTKVLYITHLHGDHNLGLPRFLEERDKLLAKMPANERKTLYLVAPKCLLDWIETTGMGRLAHPEHVCVIQHHILCPQKYYRYQMKGDNYNLHSKHLRDRESVYSNIFNDNIDKIIAAFDPT